MNEVKFVYGHFVVVNINSKIILININFLKKENFKYFQKTITRNKINFFNP